MDYIKFKAKPAIDKGLHFKTKELKDKSKTDLSVTVYLVNEFSGLKTEVDGLGEVTVMSGKNSNTLKLTSFLESHKIPYEMSKSKTSSEPL